MSRLKFKVPEGATSVEFSVVDGEVKANWKIKQAKPKVNDQGDGGGSITQAIKDFVLGSDDDDDED